jgi:hypothetical protein
VLELRTYSKRRRCANESITTIREVSSGTSFAGTFEPVHFLRPTNANTKRSVARAVVSQRWHNHNADQQQSFTMKLQQKHSKDASRRRPYHVKHSSRQEKQSVKRLEGVASEDDSTLHGYSTPIPLLSSTHSLSSILQEEHEADEQYSFISGAFVVIG